MNLSGDITAQRFVVSSSVTKLVTITNSGSTAFGDSLDDTHIYTGSLQLTGSITASKFSGDGSGLSNVFEGTAPSASISTRLTSFTDGTATSVSGSVTSTGSFGIGYLNQIGILQTNPSTMDSAADDLVIGNGDSGVDRGITIFTSAGNSKGSIHFGDATSGSGRKRGRIVYDHDGDTLTFAAANTDVLEVTDGGLEVSTGNISGSSTSTGSFGLVNTTEKVNLGSGGVSIEGSSAGTLTANVDNQTLFNILHSSGDGIGAYLTTTNMVNFGAKGSSKLGIGHSADATQQMVFNTNGDVGLGDSFDTRFIDRAKIFIENGGDVTINSDLIVTGSISGSSTSSGSFGHLQISNNDVYGRANGIAIGTAASFNSPSLAFEVTKEIDNNYVALLRNLEATAGRNFGLYIRAGSNTSDYGLQIRDKDDSLLTRVDGAGNLLLNAGDVRLTSGNVSGSVTSTGSFGRGFIDDKLSVNCDPFEPYNLTVKGGDTSGGAFFYAAQTSDQYIALIPRQDFTMYMKVGYGLEIRQNQVNGIQGDFSVSQNGTKRLLIKASSGADHGFVGINETSPTEQLHVDGNILSTGNIVAEGNITAQNFIVSSSVTSITYQSLSGSTLFGDDIGDTHRFTGSLSTSGSLQVVGEALIGTGSQAASVGVTSGQVDLLVKPNIPNIGDYTTRLVVEQPNSHSYKSDAEIHVHGYNDGRLYVGGNRQRKIIFKTNNTEASAAESWTIGTPDDSTDFQISALNSTVQAILINKTSGNITAVGNISSSAASTGSFGRVVVPARPSGGPITLGGGAFQDVIIGDGSGTADIVLDGNSESVIRYKIGGNEKWFLLARSSNNFVFRRNSADRVTIDTNGNFAIGSNLVPTERLHVGGNIFATGNISGSSTSTGSFGKLSVGVSSPDGVGLEVQAPANIARFKSTAASNNNVFIDAPTNYNANLTFTEAGTPLWYFGSTGATNNLRAFAGVGDSEVFTLTQAGRLDIAGEFHAAHVVSTGVISGSITSTGSFGHLMVGGDNFITAVSESAAASGFGGGGGASFSDGTATVISGSATSTGSFGKLAVGTATIQIPSNGFITMGSEAGMVKNTRFGAGAGQNLQAGGTQNTLIGEAAGGALTTGDKNVVMGVEALKTETGGQNNTAIGYRALKTLNQNSVGGNIALGLGAAEDLATGAFNIVIGYGADTKANDDTRSIVIGSEDTVGLGDNTTVIGGASQTLVSFGGSDTTLTLSGSMQISGSGPATSASLHIRDFSYDGNHILSQSLVMAVDGTNGRLFSVSDQMSGSIFSANTIAGLPVIEAFSTNKVTLGPFSNQVIVDSSGNLSGSATSTGSFGRVEATSFAGDGASLTNVPDYVYEPTYELKSINELEEFVTENKHLPNVPDMDNIEKWKALSVSDRDMLLLEKIEELSLYIIKLNKRIEKLENKKE